MPDDDFTDETQDDQDDEQTTNAGLSPAERRRLEKRAKQADELEQRVRKAEMNVALKELGVNLNDRQLNSLLRELGDDTSTEGVKSILTDFGWYTDPEQEQVSSELEAHGRIRNASTGATDSVAADPVAEMDALDLHDPQYPEKIMALVSKHGGNSAWESQ